MSAQLGDRVRIVQVHPSSVEAAQTFGREVAFEAGDEGTVVELYDGYMGAPEGAVYVEFDKGTEQGVIVEEYEVLAA